MEPSNYLVNRKPLHDLIRSGRLYKVPKGQNLQSTDHRVLFNLIESGYVKRYLISNDGSLGVQYIAGPNYFFPLTPVFDTLMGQKIYSGPEVYYYQTITDVELYSIEPEVLKQASENNPLVYKALLSEAGVRLQDNIQKLENLSLKSSYKRLAHLLSFYAGQFGIKTASGTRLEVPLTHQDFADSLSVTRETISAAMVQLRKKGLIKTSDGIIITNKEKLQDEAYS